MKSDKTVLDLSIPSSWVIASQWVTRWGLVDGNLRKRATTGEQLMSKLTTIFTVTNSRIIHRRKLRQVYGAARDVAVTLRRIEEKGGD